MGAMHGGSTWEQYMGRGTHGKNAWGDYLHTRASPPPAPPHSCPQVRGVTFFWLRESMFYIYGNPTWKVAGAQRAARDGATCSHSAHDFSEQAKEPAAAALPQRMARRQRDRRGATRCPVGLRMVGQDSARGLFERARVPPRRGARFQEQASFPFSLPRFRAWRPLRPCSSASAAQPARSPTSTPWGRPCCRGGRPRIIVFLCRADLWCGTRHAPEVNSAKNHSYARPRFPGCTVVPFAPPEGEGWNPARHGVCVVSS